MTSFHATDRDLHKADGTHKGRPPAGLNETERAKWRERMARHEERHKQWERPIGRAARTEVAPEFDEIRALCGRPLGRHLAALLASRDMTQPEAAQALGISPNALKQKLSGRIAWQLPEVLYLCRRLNADITDVMSALSRGS